MRLDSEMKVIVSIIIIFVTLSALSIFGVIENNKHWEKFKLEHECKIVASISSTSSIGTGINPSTGGVIITNSTIPGKIGYLCNDGVTYYR